MNAELSEVRSKGGLKIPIHCGAFTLVELMVVMAIVAILAALLVPAIGRGKALSRRASCLTRLKQWELALAMYAQDNDDLIPRESFIPGGVTINLWAQVRNPLAGDVWYNACPTVIGERRAADFAPKAARGDFYDRDRLIHCPAARFPAKAGLDDIAFFSMAMNSKLILRPSSTLKLASIQRPASTVTFLDNRLPDEPRGCHALLAKREWSMREAKASQ